MLRAIVLVASFLLTGLFASPSARAAPCAGFLDVNDTSPFCASITWMKNRGVTQGCAIGAYCPGSNVTRAEMAAFMSRLDRVLPPTLVDANGQAVGSIFTQQIGGILDVLIQRLGVRYFVIAQAFNNGGLVAYQFPRNIVYFNGFNCTGAAYIDNGSLPIPMPTTGYIATLARTPTSSLALYRSVGGVPYTTAIAATSSYASPANGSCISPALGNIVNAIPVEFVEDLTGKIVEPLRIE